jgi:hypothetical protein
VWIDEQYRWQLKDAEREDEHNPIKPCGCVADDSCLLCLEPDHALV